MQAKNACPFSVFFLSFQTQDTTTKSTSGSVGGWVGFGAYEVDTSSGTGNSDTSIGYQSSGSYDASGASGNSSSTSSSTATATSTSTSTYGSGMLSSISVSGYDSTSSSSSTSSNYSGTSSYSPGSSSSNYQQNSSSDSDTSDSGSQVTSSTNTDTVTWDTENTSTGTATLSGSSTNGISNQTNSSCVSTDSFATYTDTNTPSSSGSGGSSGSTTNASVLADDYVESVNQARTTGTFDSLGNVLQFKSSASTSSFEDYSYTNSTSTTSSSSNSSSSSTANTSASTNISYNSIQKAKLTSWGGSNSSVGFSNSFSSSISYQQTGTNTSSNSWSQSQASPTSNGTATTSVSGSYTFTYSGSNSQSGSGMAAPGTGSTSGSVNQTTNSSVTATASGSASNQYSIIEPGPSPATVTNSSLSTMSYTGSNTSTDTISGSLGATTENSSTSQSIQSSSMNSMTMNGQTDTSIFTNLSDSSSSMTFNASSGTGILMGGSSVSWTSSINGSIDSGPKSQAPPYAYSLSYSPSGGLIATPIDMGGGGSVPWLEQLGLGENQAAAALFGVGQGAINILNGISNIFGTGDWSQNTFVYESDSAHKLSVNLGGAGASILLMQGAGVATVLSKFSCITGNPLFQAAGIGLGVYGAGKEWGQFAQAISNGDGYGAVEHGGIALMNTLDLLSAFSQACFAAGTPILTPEGSKPIEEFRVGDMVLSRDENDPEGPVVARRVLSVFHSYSPLMILRVCGQEIRTTAEHPFWVRGAGWRHAQQIKPGDEIVGDDGQWREVESVEGPLEPLPVYNVEVEEYHTYFVGSEEWGFSVWAHNACTVEQARTSAARHGGVEIAEGHFQFPTRRAARQAASEIAGDLGQGARPIRLTEFRGGPHWTRNSNRVIGRQSADGTVGWRDDFLGHPRLDAGPHVNVWGPEGIYFHLFY